MRAPVVVEVDPVADQAAGVLQGFEAVTVHALLLERADTLVLPWMISSTNAVLRLSVQRLISSFINVLTVFSFRR